MLILIAKDDVSNDHIIREESIKCHTDTDLNEQRISGSH